MRRLTSTLALGLVSVVLAGCGNDKSEKTQNSPEEINRVVLSHLAQPHFISDDFTSQVTGTDAELERLNLSEGMVYFSVPAKSFDDATLARLTENPQNVEFGKLKRNKLVLGIYTFSAPGEHFFRFPAEDFRVNPDRRIEIPFSSANYNLTLDELVDFSKNRSVQGGKLSAIKDLEGYRIELVANHGALVARPGEPSLTRLVKNITQSSSTSEERAQDLLDFVTREIEYGGGDDITSLEVLKRPNEVLMTRASDCSGKVILYSSLLSQTDINHRLVYLPEHISVAVGGNFPNTNGLTFKYDGVKYSLAETTTAGFQIGSTRLRRQYSIKDIEFVQDPREDSKIINVKTGKPLRFN